MSKPENSFAPDTAPDNATPQSADQPYLPLTKNRGWTPRKQAAFLHALCSTQNVAAAARAVGMSRQSAYALRARLRGQPFDRAWDGAFSGRFDALAEAAMDRALNGVEVPHLHRGEVVHVSRRYDEKLTLGLLKLRADLLRPSPPRHEPGTIYSPSDLAELISRVAQGPETWLDSKEEELRAWFDRDPHEGKDGYYPEAEVVDEMEEYGEASSEVLRAAREKRGGNVSSKSNPE
ncbi:hypothetical protein ACFCW2_00720 [Qipengyuania sp. DSG2-2]|uniref:hypothetical protein n=1 Tax=Qipengyuania sp. DGS2-2 TaxID=3349631 RepID=UPI0036D2C824